MEHEFSEPAIVKIEFTDGSYARLRVAQITVAGTLMKIYNKVPANDNSLIAVYKSEFVRGWHITGPVVVA